MGFIRTFYSHFSQFKSGVFGRTIPNETLALGAPIVVALEQRSPEKSTSALMRTDSRNVEDVLGLGAQVLVPSRWVGSLISRLLHLFQQVRMEESPGLSTMTVAMPTRTLKARCELRI
jgi:hypothetical protein